MTRPSRRKRTLAIVSSSRADLAHLVHPLRALAGSEVVEPVVLATGAMLQGTFGRPVELLAREPVRVVPVGCDLEIERGVDAARAIGRATIGFADVLDSMDPDLLMVVADRFEMLAPASAALAMKIPVVHVEGGERSEGAIDDAVRNALTKMSHLHLVTTEAARRRVMAMGEEAWRVHRVGAGSLDHFRVGPIPNRSELEAGLGHGLGDRLVLAAVHPVTLARDPVQDAHALLDALERRARPGEVVVFAFPNADEGSRRVREAVRSFVEAREGAALHTNLEARAWIGLLHQASVVVGNSSSILMETPSVPVPAVCVGTRQAGRERAANVLDADAEPGAILAALEEAETLSMEGVTNPYGDGNASARIRRVLEEAPDRERLLSKTTTLS